MPKRKGDFNTWRAEKLADPINLANYLEAEATMTDQPSYEQRAIEILPKIVDVSRKRFEDEAGSRGSWAYHLVKQTALLLEAEDLLHRAWGLLSPDYETKGLIDEFLRGPR